MRNIGTNVSCLAPERAHKWTHTIGAFSFQDLASTLTTRMVAWALDEATRMDNFKACVLGPIKPRGWRNHDGLAQAYFRNIGAQVASSAKTHVGGVRARGIIALRCPHGGVAVGWWLV